MGGQKGIAFFYQFLSKKIAVTLVSTRNNKKPDDLHAEFLPILSDSKLRYINPLMLFSTLQILKKKQSTHLFLEHPYMGWLGLLIKLFYKTRLVIHSHNIESLRFKSTGKWWWWILWHYERFVHRNSDINFFITDEDRQYAIEKFGLYEAKCHTITYGFDLSAAPSSEDKNNAKSYLQRKYCLPVNNTIILFNGTLDYKPNQDAIDIILNQINPVLLEHNQFHYSIIICGKNLPSKYNNLINFQQKNILYAGFVEDISLFFKGADLFINPVIDGGGIKTKLVEALGFDLFCVSTKNGAIGVPVEICNQKLNIITDNNWISFANSIISANPHQYHINEVFFNHFFWENITNKAINIIND